MLKKVCIAFFTALCCFLSAPAQAKKLTLIYIPLDNRPVCSAYARQTMEAAGCKILMPPEKYLADASRSGDPEALWQWLAHRAEKADAAVISADSLIYGGLVASRTHHFDNAVLESRVKRLNYLERTLPIKLYVFSTIMRTPRASFGNVEPPYYPKIGPAIFAYSELLDKETGGGSLTITQRLKKQALERNLRQDELGDWLKRRAKNLAVNRELTFMLRSGKFHYLATGKDDNAPLSATHMEASQLSRSTFDLPPERFQIISGVDQLGLLLLARAYNEANHSAPLIYPLYSEGVGAATLPQYSDVRLQDSVPQQITAAGARQAANAANADLILALNTPPDGAVQDGTASSNQYFASPANNRFIETLRRYLDAGCQISLADISYSNGADNGFMNALATQKQLPRLAAYNGWNTADNAVGFAIAQGILARQMPPEKARLLMQQRVIDDWYYQSNARHTASDTLDAAGFSALKYTLGDAEKPVLKLVEEQIRFLSGKYAFTRGADYELAFPWQRLFEINVTMNGL